MYILHSLGPPGPPVSSTNKTDHHDKTEILLKVALNTINHQSTILHLQKIFLQYTESKPNSSFVSTVTVFIETISYNGHGGRDIHTFAYHQE